MEYHLAVSIIIYYICCSAYFLFTGKHVHVFGISHRILSEKLKCTLGLNQSVSYECILFQVLSSEYQPFLDTIQHQVQYCHVPL